MQVSEKEVEQEVKRYFKKPRHWPILALITIALVGIIVSLYFILVYSNMCEDEACFSTALIRCARTVYIRQGESSGIALRYDVLGRGGGSCKVKVTFVQVRRGSSELKALEGKEMICRMSLGIYARPENNIKNCNGLLKEGIQEIIIQRMHSEIMENVGEIKEEITKVI